MINTVLFLFRPKTLQHVPITGSKIMFLKRLDAQHQNKKAGWADLTHLLDMRTTQKHKMHEACLFQNRPLIQTGF